MLRVHHHDGMEEASPFWNDAELDKNRRTDDGKDAKHNTNDKKGHILLMARIWVRDHCI